MRLYIFVEENYRGGHFRFLWPLCSETKNVLFRGLKNSSILCSPGRILFLSNKPTHVLKSPQPHAPSLLARSCRLNC